MPAFLIPILLAILPQLGKLFVDIFTFLNKPGVDGMSVVERAAQLAEWHVQNMMQSDASGDEKRKMAREALLADFKREGQTIEESVLNMVVEIAYNGLKAKATPGTVVPQATPA